MEYPKGQALLDYLRARGLKDDIIKKKRFGYVPLGKDGRWYLGTFEHWGLDPDLLLPGRRERGGVCIPPGILIPWSEGDILWRLGLKRPGQPKGKDYGQVVGSGEGMFNIDQVHCGQPAMIVESEICACSVEQEAGDLIACVATGSTCRARIGRWISDLALASVVLQSFDEDEAGDNGSAYWCRALKNSMRWSPMVAKDPNELLQHEREPGALCTLRQWVGYGLQTHAGQPVVAIEHNLTPGPEKQTPDIQPEHQVEKVEVRNKLESMVRIVDVLGDVELLKRIKHNPIVPMEHPPYQPVTLPALPRSKCPHQSLEWQHISDKVARPVVRACSGMPLEYGWCEEHRASYDLLCLLATLGYPRLELGARGIEAGVANAEVYACQTSPEHTLQDIKRIRARFASALNNHKIAHPSQ
ncbi:hypothetical protein KDW_27940 [Dictyobacter vulcani]|uniref:Toprim domain-containing protein n=1 Tax=Dictyobacter vulcani TaxID=2607529 RepID=A0A5J4KN82_9CHLR|nr:hypothetical protein [Dictyobacter vulcani]GER88632.1 hypothetical protein KDW_27940 [Dictyobacter vulcani]